MLPLFFFLLFIQFKIGLFFHRCCIRIYCRCLVRFFFFFLSISCSFAKMSFYYRSNIANEIQPRPWQKKVIKTLRVFCWICVIQFAILVVVVILANSYPESSSLQLAWVLFLLSFVFLSFCFCLLIFSVVFPTFL